MFKIIGHKILFRFNKKAKWSIIYKRELLPLLISLIFSVLSIIFLFKDFTANYTYAWFFPTLLLAYLCSIYYRRKAHFHLALKQDEWNKIFKDPAPFVYDDEGFTITLDSFGNEKVKWTDISKIMAYRHEKLDVDTIEVIVEVANKFSFSVVEFSHGSVHFFEAIKKSLALKNAYWYGTISSGDTSLVVYDKKS